MKLVALAVSTGLTCVYALPKPESDLATVDYSTEGTYPMPTVEPSSELPFSSCDSTEPYCHYFSDLNLTCDSRYEWFERGERSNRSKRTRWTSWFGCPALSCSTRFCSV